MESDNIIANLNNIQNHDDADEKILEHIRKNVKLLKYTTPGIMKNIPIKDQKKQSIDYSFKNQSTKKIEEILNLILPVKIVTKGSKQFVYKVSPLTSSIDEIIQLQEKFDKYLVTYKAKLNGICHIRSQLFSQLFDEVIRQVTIGCIEQGLLLGRLRDEINETICSYEKLYEKGNSYGIRKWLLHEKEMNQLKIHAYNQRQIIESKKLEIEGLKVQISEKSKKLAKKNRELKETDRETILSLIREIDDHKEKLWTNLFPKEEYIPSPMIISYFKSSA